MPESKVDSKNLSWLIDLLIPMIQGAKNRRRSIENEWLLNYKTWQGWPSQTYTLPLPDNAVHYFIPHARRSIEKRVKQVTKLLLSNITKFEALPSDSSIPHENAEAVNTVIDYILTKKIPLRRNIGQLARIMYLYDFPVLHTSVVIQNKQVWPYQRVIDPYSFYIYPDTAINLEDAILLFEESIVPYQIYKTFVNENEKKSIYSSINLDSLHIPEWPYHLVERIAYRGLTIPSDFNQGTTGNSHRYVREADVELARNSARTTLAEASKAFVQLFKCYFRLGSTWFYAVICNNLSSPKVVRLDEEENSPTYRWTNSRSLPGELYTNSETDDIRVLQNLSNSALSQMESNRSTYAEPPIGVDLNAVGRMQEYTFGNRKFWKVDGNPKEIFQPIQVNDTSSESMKATQIYMQLIDKESGGTLAEGNPGRNMPRSGQMANTLLGMAMIEVEDVAQTLESDILSPSLGDIYHNILEYVPSKQLFQIPNKNPQLVKAYSKQDLQGDFSFNWLGSLGFQDSQARADKFFQFFQVILNPEIMQMLNSQLQLQGQMLDILGMLKTWYSFGLGEKGLGDIIVPIPPQVMQAMQQAQQSQQQNDPKMLEAQSKLQESQVKTQLAQAKGITSIQEHKAKLQGHELDNQGRVLDLALKQKELRGKDLEHRQNLLTHLQSIFTPESKDTGD